MFAENFLEVGLVDIIGFSITLLGIWLVVRQLNEARLASQMEGLITLSEMEARVERLAVEVRNYTGSEGWRQLNEIEAFSNIWDREDYKEGFVNNSRLYELISVLVRTKALDEEIAYKQFGYFLPQMWRQFEKPSRGAREKLGNKNINEHWEWLAHKFEQKG